MYSVSKVEFLHARPRGHALDPRSIMTEAEAASPIIFLDVDGVLNTHAMQASESDCVYPQEYAVRMMQNGLVLSRSRLAALASIVADYDCRIVVSSTWRVQQMSKLALVAALAEVGVAPERVVGSTKELHSKPRAFEIKEWLTSHEHTGPWVAIDDIDLGSQDPVLMRDHFVRTSMSAGLVEDRADEVRRLLKLATDAPAVREAMERTRLVDVRELV